MASLRELNQRRVDRMGGKGMYEDQVDGLTTGLRQMFGNGGSPRMTEGQIPAQSTKSEDVVTQPERGATTPSIPGGVSLPKKPFDVGYDLSPRNGLRREAFEPSIQNQGQTSGDRLVGTGYATRQVQGAPGVTRLDGNGRTVYTDDQVNAADWIEGGMRPGVSTVSGPSVAELTARAERMRSLREASTAMRDEQSFNAGGALSRQKTQQEVVRDLLAGNSRSGRQVAAGMIDSENRLRAEGLRSAADMARFAEESRLDQERLGLDRERFEFEKAPKPMGALDQVRLAEARYGLRERVADRARKELEGRGLNPDQQNRVLENVGESLVYTDPARMQTELAKHLPTLRATDLANQYSLGGLTSAGDVTPVGLRGYKLSEVDLFGNDDPNAPTLSEYLWNLGNDKAIIEDSAGSAREGGAPGKPVRLINAARVKASGDGKNIDLLRRLGIE